MVAMVLQFHHNAKGVLPWCSIISVRNAPPAGVGLTRLSPLLAGSLFLPACKGGQTQQQTSLPAIPFLLPRFAGRLCGTLNLLWLGHLFFEEGAAA